MPAAWLGLDWHDGEFECPTMTLLTPPPTPIPSAQPKRPALLLLATGGTIAGFSTDPQRTGRYEPGALTAQALVQAVPALTTLARVICEQPYAIGSEHLRSSHWMQLVRRVRQAHEDDQITGIVITHGTDTLEESALVLDLLCPRRLPVVLTGAMRPAGALSADGPMNLLCAARTAIDPRARGAGTLVVMNDRVLAPDRVWKTHTSRVDAFAARETGVLASIQDGQAHWHGDPIARAHERPSLFEALPHLPETLPRVDLVSAHVDMDAALIDWLVSQGSRALVVAGIGHGTFANALQQALVRAVNAGCLVVRASRVPEGGVWPGCGQDDASMGTLAAGPCTPHKARTAVSLALAAGWGAERIQALLLAL
jgi:L-asparaginase